MGQTMIVIGIICAALAAWLIPHGYFILSKEKATMQSQTNSAIKGNLKGENKVSKQNMNSDPEKGKTIIGKRIRVTIGDEAPKDDDENTIVADDTNVVVSPEEAQGKTIIGEKVELNIGSEKKENTDK